MPSVTSFLAIFFAIAFIAGSAFGALLLFIISIHRNGRTSLFDADEQQRGATSRSLLVTARTGRKENGQ